MSDISRAADHILQLSQAEADHSKHDCLAAKTVKDVQWQKRACEDFIMDAAPQTLEDVASLFTVFVERARIQGSLDGLLPVALRTLGYLSLISGHRSPLPKLYGLMRNQ